MVEGPRIDRRRATTGIHLLARARSLEPVQDMGAGRGLGSRSKSVRSRGAMSPGPACVPPRAHWHGQGHGHAARGGGGGRLLFKGWVSLSDCPTLTKCRKQGIAKGGKRNPFKCSSLLIFSFQGSKKREERSMVAFSHSSQPAAICSDHDSHILLRSSQEARNFFGLA